MLLRRTRALARCPAQPASSPASAADGHEGGHDGRYEQQRRHPACRIVPGGTQTARPSAPSRLGCRALSSRRLFAMVGIVVKPPQGRIQVGWRVRTADGGRGEVVAERLIEPNGAWYYVVAFDDGRREELPDYALRHLQSDARDGD